MVFWGGWQKVMWQGVSGMGVLQFAKPYLALVLSKEKSFLCHYRWYLPFLLCFDWEMEDFLQRDKSEPVFSSCDLGVQCSLGYCFIRVGEGRGPEFLIFFIWLLIPHGLKEVLLAHVFHYFQWVYSLAEDALPPTWASWAPRYWRP